AVGLVLATVACGGLYVMAHEERRRYKKANPKPQPEPEPDVQQAGGSQGGGRSFGAEAVSVMPKELLIEALLETADAAFSLIEQVPLAPPNNLWICRAATPSLPGNTRQAHAPCPPAHAQTRRAVYILHKEKGLSIDAARDRVHGDFQTNMQLVIRSVNNKHGVNDSQLTASTKFFSEEKAVTDALEIMSNAMNGDAPPARALPVVAPRLRGNKRRGKG
ncbi:hypothetical protein T492DRAFT_1007291, partial [Pavlovales sp. CCMP2436]